RVLPEPPPQDHDLRALQREGYGCDSERLQADRRKGPGRPVRVYGSVRDRQLLRRHCLPEGRLRPGPRHELPPG
ncbi:Transcriptional regulator, partial [Dysosmobacter welbionis]